MKRSRSLVTYGLLFVFAVLMLKTILPYGTLSDCNEFAHIHKFKLEKIFKKDTLISSAHQSDEACHAAQSIFAVAAIPMRIFTPRLNLNRTAATFAIVTQTPLPSPCIEPPRIPPRKRA